MTLETFTAPTWPPPAPAAQSPGAALTGAVDLLPGEADVEGVGGVAAAGQLDAKLRGRHRGQLPGSLAEVGVFGGSDLPWKGTESGKSLPTPASALPPRDRWLARPLPPSQPAPRPWPSHPAFSLLLEGLPCCRHTAPSLPSVSRGGTPPSILFSHLLYAVCVFIRRGYRPRSHSPRLFNAGPQL